MLLNSGTYSTLAIAMVTENGCQINMRLHKLVLAHMSRYSIMTEFL